MAATQTGTQRIRAKAALWLFGLVSAGVSYNALAAVIPNEFCVFVDCPGTPLSSGHAFISLTAGSNFKAAGTTYTRGLAPDSWDIFGGAGKIQDDGCHSWDYMICWNIPDAKYIAVANFINAQQKNTPNYDLLDSNCVGWAQNAAGVAGVTPPDGINRAGIQDPSALCDQLTNIGNGGTYKGGTVTKNANPAAAPDAEYIDFSYEQQESDIHTYTASQEGAFMNLPSVDQNLGDVSVGAGSPLLVIINNESSDALLSIDWGDGSNYGEQSLTFSHAYASPGTYNGSVAVIDAGSVQRYAFSAQVGAGGGNALAVNCASFAAAGGDNAGGCGLGTDIPTDVAVPEPSFLGLATMIGTGALGVRRRK